MWCISFSVHLFPLFGSFTTELMCGPFSEFIMRSFKFLFDIEVLNLLKINSILSRNPLSQGTLEICIKIANFSSMTRFGMFPTTNLLYWLYPDTQFALSMPRRFSNLSRMKFNSSMTEGNNKSRICSVDQFYGTI